MKESKHKLANKAYGRYLKEAQRVVGKKTTYLSQLEGAGHKFFGAKFKGVFPSDKIPKLNDLACYCILNLDRSDQGGSHWIGLAKIPNEDKCLVYDSFGRDHKKIIKTLGLSGNGRIVNTDRDAEQHIKQTDCGSRCLAFLMVCDRDGYGMAKLI